MLRILIYWYVLLTAHVIVPGNVCVKKSS